MKFKPKPKLTPERLKGRISRVRLVHYPYKVTPPKFSLSIYDLVMQLNETCPRPKSETFSDADFY